MTEQRFTVDGDAGLERHLAGVCRDVRRGVEEIIPFNRLAGLLLGGGYGRGEGGVLRTPEGDRPYNDMEFYVFVREGARPGQHGWRAALHDLGERLSAPAGVEVEFKVLTGKKLKGSSPCMFYYDLLMGHRLLQGDPSLLSGCDHHSDPTRLPLHEATRLLMNRCSGLLYSAARLASPSWTPEEADFVGRNLAKAQLSYGDVVLTAHGQYHWSCRVRQEKLRDLEPVQSVPELDAIRNHHSRGVEFKLHPQRSVESRDTLAHRHRELSQLGRTLWLWLEARRLAQDFASAHAYASSHVDKCPETSRLKNALIHLRDFGWTRRGGLRLSFTYPRQRLFHALCWLLWEPEVFGNPDMLARVQQELRSEATELAGLVEAYRGIWNRYN